VRDIVGISLTMALLFGLLSLVGWAAGRLKLSGELKRKSVHIGMGMATLTFPWIFTNPWAVTALGVLCVLALIGLKRREGGEGSVLHDVDRQTWGDVLFPAAVVAVYWMAEGEWLRYVIPILILTLADAVGALVGTRYGQVKFKVLSGGKSIEGSALFFITAFLSAHVPLLLFAELEPAATLLIALILAIVVMMFEAISTRGLDNLLVPISSAYLLDQYLGMEVSTLLWRLLLITTILCLVLYFRRYSSLEGGALVAIVLVGYACWAWGDWRFLVPPIILYVDHLMVTRRLQRRISNDQHDLWPIMSVSFSMLPWVLGATLWPQQTNLFLGLFVITAAIHLTVLNLTTRVFLAKKCASFRMIRRSIAKSVFLIALPGWLLVESSLLSLVSVLLTAVLVALAVYIFMLGQGNPRLYSIEPRRWTHQGVLAALIASLGFLFPLYHL